MQRQLLLVGQAKTLTEERLQNLFLEVPHLHCKRIDWVSLAPEHISEREAALILLIADPAVPQTTRTLDWLRENPVGKPTLAIIPEDADVQYIQLAAEAVDDFVLAPLRREELRHRILRILGEATDDVRSVSERLAQEMTAEGLVGRDPAFLETLSRIPLASRSKAPVLIAGETGTGKELCARAIHALGARGNAPFIPVDCASLPEHLFENELFGHSRGAFTDARTDQKGLIALAQGGTLFLDEIDAVPLSAQSKLLRFLQERIYRPLGSDYFHHVDLKIVAATNKDLEGLVRARQFRADLLFRLNVLRLHLPPLRERRIDIALLAEAFITKFCAENGMPRKRLAAPALRSLTEYAWPGNVRELYNVIQRAILFSEGTQIMPWHLDQTPHQPAPASANTNFREARARAIESFERRYIVDLLRECNGNISRAALIAQKERRAFGRLVKRYDLKKDLGPVSDHVHTDYSRRLNFALG